MFLNDNIVAISTAPGIGAISIVRISGPESSKIIDKCFVGSKKIVDAKPNTITFGKFIDNTTDQVFDTVLVSKFVSPHSFTGQDSIEINCHGGNFIASKILDIIVQNGARLADPGEFTQRAFINGKIDLVQAEAIADLIHTSSEKSHQISINELSGLLSDRLDQLKSDLSYQCSLLEIELDFSEEDIEFADRTLIKKHLEIISTNAKDLLDTFTYGRIIKEGINLVIVGKPNVGKSSILNRLLNTNRAIVSDIPGTTRDHISESFTIKGYQFNIIDTAGLRETDDQIENLGILKTIELAQNADFILCIYDATEFEESENYINEKLGFLNDKIFINVINKSDIKNVNSDFIKISALKGTGFDLLEENLINIILNLKGFGQDLVISKSRHKANLDKIVSHLNNSINSIEENLPSEFVANDLRMALDVLGELTGQVTTDDILNDIFSNFCIGK